MLQAIPGIGPKIGVSDGAFANSFTDSSVIDATGEKLAFVGRFFHKDRTTKTVTRIGFRFGAVTKAGGSALTVSLQNLSASSGPPLTPDETQDQTVAIANANASFAANTWIRTDALSAGRSVAFGELLCVVIEYDGGGRLGADSVAISSFTPPALSSMPGASLKTAGFAANTIFPNMVLECDDGTFGGFQECHVASSLSSVAYNSGSAGADEYGAEFSLTFPCKVDGGRVQMAAATSADFEVILYDGTSAIANATIAVDQNQLASAGQRVYAFSFSEPIELAANTTYRLGIRPTTVNNVTLYYSVVSDANHFQCQPLGTSFCMASRINQGSWAAATTTQRPHIQLNISHLDDGTGSAPAGNMRGGITN